MKDDLPDVEEVLACLGCERNHRQAELIRRLWSENSALKKRIKKLQATVAKHSKPVRPKPKFAEAEALFQKKKAK